MDRIERVFEKNLRRGLQDSPQLIHVVVGPRQVGKTTGVLAILKGLKKTKYVAADGDIRLSSSWLTEQWQNAEAEIPGGVLAIDEIQKVENWSETIKKFWDQQRIRTSTPPLKLILLGSSSLQMETGLSESLAGRFFIHPASQWSLDESEKLGLDLETYLRFGGYPGSYAFIKEPRMWMQYVEKSIIDPVLGKDILHIVRVKSPSLFKQCFEMISEYPAQEISYTKLLGQLQDRGNTDLIKHYLGLFESAFLMKQLFKYSAKPRLARTSSPKILPACPAFYSLKKQTKLTPSDLGRSFECLVGNELLKLPGSLSYWREGNHEVDFIYKVASTTYAIEVKWSEKQSRGLEVFSSKFPKSVPIIMNQINFRNQLKMLREDVLL